MRRAVALGRGLAARERDAVVGAMEFVRKGCRDGRLCVAAAPLDGAPGEGGRCRRGLAPATAGWRGTRVLWPYTPGTNGSRVEATERVKGGDHEAQHGSCRSPASCVCRRASADRAQRGGVRCRERAWHRRAGFAGVMLVTVAVGVCPAYTPFGISTRGGVSTHGHVRFGGRTRVVAQH